MIKKENMTIPNLLSLSRLVFLPILFYYAMNEMRLAFLIAYTLLASTDFFDGLIARKFNQLSPLGTTMDTIADVPFYISTAFFIYKLHPEILRSPNMLLLTIGLSIVGLSFIISILMFKKPIMMHTSIMRLPAVLVFFLIIFSYFFDTANFLSAILIIYCIGFMEEIIIFIIYGEVHPDSKSIYHIAMNKKPNV